LHYFQETLPGKDAEGIRQKNETEIDECPDKPVRGKGSFGAVVGVEGEVGLDQPGAE